MNDQTPYSHEEEYNQRFLEIVALLTEAQACVTDLQQKLVNIHPYTTQGRLEREQQFFWNDYFNSES